MLLKEWALESWARCLGAGLGAFVLGSWAHAWAPAWAPAWARAWAPAWAPADRFFEFANANMRSRPLVHAFRLNWGRVLSSQSFENGAGVLQALGAGLGGLGRTNMDPWAFSKNLACMFRIALGSILIDPALTSCKDRSATHSSWRLCKMKLFYNY